MIRRVEIKQTIVREYGLTRITNQLVYTDTGEVATHQKVHDGYAFLTMTGYHVKMRVNVLDDPDTRDLPVFGVVENITDLCVYVDLTPIARSKFHALYEVD